MPPHKPTAPTTETEQDSSSADHFAKLRTGFKQPRAKAKRMGAERLKHNASERKRKLEFNTRLEELKRLTPNLSSTPSKREIIESAAHFIQELLTERAYYRQVVTNMEQRFALAEQHQRHEHQLLQQLQKAYCSQPPPPPPSAVLPPLRVALSQELHPFTSASSYPSYSAAFFQGGK
ncbi:hypothetical protein QOT17_004955 [Balamuthia mandrillaris]